MNYLVVDASSMGYYGLVVPKLPLEGADSPKAVGKRLWALRHALGNGRRPLSQDIIARRIGIDSGSATWTHYEEGSALIPATRALALCRLCPITMDWLYRGLWMASVQVEFQEKIRFAEMRALEGKKPKRR